MHDFFLGPICKAFEHVHFLPAEEQDSSLMDKDMFGEDKKGQRHKEESLLISAFKVMENGKLSPVNP